MIHSEIIKDKNILHQWTDNSKMELLQEDTGVQYSNSVYDIVDTKHKYKEVPKIESKNRMLVK